MKNLFKSRKVKKMSNQLDRDGLMDYYINLIKSDYTKINVLPWDKIKEDQEMHAMIILSYVSALYQRQRYLISLTSPTYRAQLESYGIPVFDDFNTESLLQADIQRELAMIESELDLYAPEVDYAQEILKQLDNQISK